MEKICSKCCIIKDVSEFNQKKTNKDGLQSWCCECQRKRSKQHYEQNKHMYCKRNKRNRQRNRDWLNEYKKSLCCSRCKESRWYVLDFHHTNPNKKERTISQIVSTWGIERTKKEMEKCEVLCRNCHAEHHYLERSDVV